MKKWTINSSRLVSSWACEPPYVLNYLDGMGVLNFLFPARLWSKLYSYMYVFTGKTTLNLGIRNMRWRNGPSTPVVWSAHERVRLPTPLTFWAQRSHSTFSFLPIFEASYSTGKTTLNLGIRIIRWRAGPSSPIIRSTVTAATALCDLQQVRMWRGGSCGKRRSSSSGGGDDDEGR